MLPEDGNAYEAGQPPLYYAVTADRSVGSSRATTSTRSGGSVRSGSAVGAVALYLTLRRFQVADALRGRAEPRARPLAAARSFAASSVSNDIAVWTFGAVALLAVVVG